MSLGRVNREYKDRLFCLLFGDEKYKENTLSLYNALNGTSYEDVDALEITTIEDVLYMGMKNDVSFIIADTLSLYEQQSTLNNNMPLRGFLYFAKLYDKRLVQQKANIYKKKLVKIPAPRYIVFYNGKENLEPAMTKLRLSDAFIGQVPKGEFEWTATMHNLNHPDTKPLLQKCRPLYEYTCLVQKIQAYSAKYTLYEAVTRAVDHCIQERILVEFLIAHKAEVIDVVLTEFNQEIYEEDLKEEARQEGLQQGLQQGLEEGLEDFVQFLAESVTDLEKLYQTVVKRPKYKDKTREQVFKYLR